MYIRRLNGIKKGLTYNSLCVVLTRKELDHLVSVSDKPLTGICAQTNKGRGIKRNTVWSMHVEG